VQGRHRVMDRRARLWTAPREGREALGLTKERIQLGLLAVLRVQEVGTHRVAGPEDLDPGHVPTGEIAAEGHKRGRTAGEPRHGLGAVGVAGGVVGVRAERTRNGGDLAEVLAAEPADLVELVHAHVPEDAAAGRPERGAGRLLVPLGACEQMDLAELAALDLLPQCLEGGNVPPPIRDLEWHAVAVDGLLGLADPCAREATWLLAQDRQAGRRNLCDQLDVERSGSGDQHGVDAARGEELRDVLEHRSPRFGHGRACLRAGLDPRRRLDGGRSGERAEMGPAHASGTDQPEAEHPVTHSPNRARYWRLARWS